MSAFNFMSQAQAVKVRVDVTTDTGKKGYDIYEFYLNAPPLSDPLVLGIAVWPQTNNGTVYSTQYSYDVSGWKDTVDDTELQLDFKIYANVDGKILLLKDLERTSTHTFNLPYLSTSDNSLHNISICVGAVDKYNSYTYKCNDVWNVANNFDGNVRTLVTNLKALDLNNKQ